MKFTKPKTAPKKAHKHGVFSKDEKALVKAAVRQGGGDLSTDQTRALAKVFNRPVGTIKSMIRAARENLAADASFYVDTHREVTEQAREAGIALFNDKLLDIARKGSEWALESISGEGSRIVEKAESGPAGTRIMIGVRLGNTTLQPNATVDISPDAVIDAE